MENLNYDFRVTFHSLNPFLECLLVYYLSIFETNRIGLHIVAFVSFSIIVLVCLSFSHLTISMHAVGPILRTSIIQREIYG